jgi:GTP-binding protein
VYPINILQASLAATAVWPSQFPTDGRPEIAFAGKSPVGKSSLINALVGRNKLARSSKPPGKTRTLNFYAVEYKHEAAVPLYFVDLPGYGYAKVSQSESEKWGGMVEGYLKERAPLKALFLLLDIRHEPGAHDKMLFEWCQYYQLPFTVIATKCDKLKRSQIPAHLAAIRKKLGLAEPPLAFSSETKQNRDALWALILDRIQPPVI